MSKGENITGNKTCNRCGKHFSYDSSDLKWDESGYGYSTRYVKCPHCDQIHVLYYVEDRWIQEESNS